MTLSKRVAIGGMAAACCVVLGICSLLVVGAPRVSANPKPATLTLEVKNDQVARHDFGNPGLDVGDMDVFSDILSVDGNVVGHDGGACFFTNIAPDSPTAYCELTIQLAQGQIFARGLTPHTLAPMVIAITGGTGDYSDARGEITVTGVASPAEKYVVKFS
ncbi:allene oxide cyclase barrel-like domain-containing protein [Nocardia arthritidis]|uniref:Allene oxide cyclase barrel-like domain-containing protein n=1 Tax=Nocardia arthritidis TaxID=228602 RepID=A0A6G9YPX1_9NOCA|nr:hypothetical protein [Nocardia arthritidis]QIS15066.1 hypothetical protein F5544_36185 [Nocardia arthritidis]